MKNYITLFCVFLSLFLGFSLPLFGQFSVPITPICKTHSLSQDIPIYYLPSFDNDSLKTHYNNQSDATEFTSNIFAKVLSVDINILCDGKWDTLENGDKVWRIKIYSENANGLKLICNKFKLPKGASLYFYGREAINIFGAYTHLNNGPDGKFGTCRLPGNELIVEYDLPSDIEDPGDFHISQIGYVFTNTIHIGLSGSCNINANCLPYVNEWCNEIRSVIKIEPISVINDEDTVFTACSGVFLNNENQDFDPLILTAKHCMVTSSGEPQYIDTPRPFPELWTIYYNFQANPCSDNTGNDKMTSMGVEIVTFSERNNCPDLGLLRVLGQPNWGYNIYFAGWNREKKSKWPSDNIITFHHPKGDLKKVSKGVVTGSAVNCWKIKYSKGITEKGSSGGPSFDENFRVIGVQSREEISCDNPDKKTQAGKIEAAQSASFDWDNNIGSGETLVGIDPIGACQQNMDIVGSLYPGKDWQRKNQIIVQVSQTITFAANNIPTSIMQSPPNMSTIENSDYIFRAGTSISMKAGFSVKANNSFSARIQPCLPFDGSCGANFSVTPSRPEKASDSITDESENIYNQPFEGIKIIPNPNYGFFEIFSSLGKYIEKVEIVHTSGKTVWDKTISDSLKSRILVSGLNLPSGYYYVRVKVDNIEYVSSIIIKTK